MERALDSAVRSGMRMFATLAVAVGVALLLVVTYLLVWTGHGTSSAQAELKEGFRASTAAPGAPAAAAASGAGDGIALLHIPALGARWNWAVVEGVGDSDLARGPGHFPGTALPGAIGNFAVAGHRATHGQPFAHLDKLKAGDAIVVENREGWFTYRVTWTKILAATATDVIAPVSGESGVVPTQSTLTLVTCHPRWSSSKRLVVHATLVDQRASTAGAPDVLAR